MKKFNIYFSIIKPILDFISAFIVLVIGALPMLIVAVLIKIEDGGKVFFKQERPGKDEKIFTLLKFRTMSENPDLINKTEHDMARMTRIGKFLRKTSMDELPQMINILRGEMSFIGPRPLLPEYLTLYDVTQKHRHDVKPGISGLAQVNGRNTISWHQKFEYDINYVNNISFIMDSKILLKTIKNILTTKDVDQNSKQTVELFNGKN